LNYFLVQADPFQPSAMGYYTFHPYGSFVPDIHMKVYMNQANLFSNDFVGIF